MTIFESGQKQMPAGINNFRRRSTVGLNILVAADRQDFVCFDGQSFRPRLLDIQGIDFGVYDDGVSGTATDLLLRPGFGEGKTENRQERRQQSQETFGQVFRAEQVFAPRNLTLSLPI